MTSHLVEMRGFIAAADAPSFEDNSPVMGELLDEGVVEGSDKDALLEDLAGLRFKLESFRELDEDQAYALGVETGLAKAADMIAEILSRHR